MERLERDHPKVIRLLSQLQGQYEQIGKIAAVVAYANILRLRGALLECGWMSGLAEDGKTVVLWPAETFGSSEGERE
jgi:hypothetical protein